MKRVRLLIMSRAQACQDSATRNPAQDESAMHNACLIRGSMLWHHPIHTLSVLGTYLTCLMTLAQNEGWHLEAMMPPTSMRSMAPNLCQLGQQVGLSWIEPEENNTSRVLLARWDGSAFEAPQVIVTSKHMFANWADIPSVFEAPDGDWYAQWLQHLGSGTYAYGIRLLRSTDQGQHWSHMGWLHDDLSEVEHGFVSFAPEGHITRAFWLDGRDMTQPGGTMTLRTTTLMGSQIGEERILDENVCTCCPTAAVSTKNGPMVLYRDRTPSEVRDISFISRKQNQWTAPEDLASDQWVTPGCPVNGPTITQNGKHLAVTRFTAAKNHPKIILQIFREGNLNSPIEVVLDDQQPIGGCSSVSSDHSIYITWLDTDESRRVIRMAELSWDGTLKQVGNLNTLEGSPFRGRTASLLIHGELWITWTDTGGVQLARLKVAS